jgi:hypothetical protein
MANNFFRYPPRPSSGNGTFSDNIVGLQTVDGGGLTQGNFEFTTSITEKINREFNTGVFSNPISLNDLDLNTVQEAKTIIAKEFKVYPNYDLSEVTKFNLYGSLTKRLSVSIQKIINFFPASLDVRLINSDFSTGYTAINVVYDSIENTTTFNIDVIKLNNPFDIDYSKNAERNISAREYVVSPLRNLTKEFRKYSIFVDDIEYDILMFSPTNSLFRGQLEIIVSGNPFPGEYFSVKDFIIKPNTFYTEKTFTEAFDEVERYLLNRLITPKYTAQFQIPKETDEGLNYISYENVTWPLEGSWNLDIRTLSFDNYLSKISTIASDLDTYRTNLISRFLVTDAFKEFDTDDQRVSKILNIYGRSFDEVKKFIDALAFMNSVNYTTGNDIPSQLLKNLAETLGWSTNISPISDSNFLDSVFGTNSPSMFGGYSISETPTEINYQFYKNLILNSAYLFKSKGTRKSIEGLLRLIGAPESLVEFNEYIYIAGQRINMSEFNNQYASISGGTYSQELPVLDNNLTFSIYGKKYSGFTSEVIISDSDTLQSDYPVDSEGYPKAPEDTEDFYFQKGAGWFELVKTHQSPQVINQTNSVFTGQNFSIQTQFEPFTYGEKYLERFRSFPNMTLGFDLKRVPDNKKSWGYNDNGLRTSFEGNQNAYYYVGDEKLVLNVKNVELFLNPAQGLLYDVWSMSNKYNYPIPSSGLSTPYPTPNGIDWTFINPQPNKKTFFEFAQTFWQKTINVRNRFYTSDGKTSGYPTLQSIYWDYLNSGQAINVPNDNFNYRTMIDYVQGLGDYWVRLVEQMIPATTIWQTGTKFENSIFHRQKFVYRYQRGCQIIPVPCEPCIIEGSLFPYDCVLESISCPIYPWLNGNPLVNSFSDVLYQSLVKYLATQSKSINDCLTNTLITDWYIDLRIDSNILIQQKIYTGFGLIDIPTNDYWINQLNIYLQDLVYSGYDYIIQDNILTLFNLGCEPFNANKNFQLNIGLDFKITCN